MRTRLRQALCRETIAWVDSLFVDLDKSEYSFDYAMARRRAMSPPGHLDFPPVNIFDIMAGVLSRVAPALHKKYPEPYMALEEVLGLDELVKIDLAFFGPEASDYTIEVFDHLYSTLYEGEEREHAFRQFLESLTRVVLRVRGM